MHCSLHYNFLNLAGTSCPSNNCTCISQSKCIIKAHTQGSLSCHFRRRLLSNSHKAWLPPEESCLLSSKHIKNTSSLSSCLLARIFRSEANHSEEYVESVIDRDGRSVVACPFRTKMDGPQCITAIWLIQPSVGSSSSP